MEANLLVLKRGVCAGGVNFGLGVGFGLIEAHELRHYRRLDM